MKLQDVMGDKCWPFCVSPCLFLSLGTGAWNDVSMEDLQSCIMNQDDSSFFQDLTPQVRKEKHSCWSVYFVRAEGRESLRQAYIKLFSFYCLSFFIWGDVATGTKSLVWVQPFLSNDFRSSCGDVCCPAL